MSTGSDSSGRQASYRASSPSPRNPSTATQSASPPRRHPPYQIVHGNSVPTIPTAYINATPDMLAPLQEPIRRRRSESASPVRRRGTRDSSSSNHSQNQQIRPRSRSRLSSSSYTTPIPPSPPTPLPTVRVVDAHNQTNMASTHLPEYREEEDDDDDDDNDDGHRVLQSDPTGRFECWDICLGKGAYKEVYKAFDHEEGVEVAWNQLRTDYMSKKDIQKIFGEVKLLKLLHHENIINFFHVWTAKGLDGRERVFFITELMTSGTLKSFIRKAKGKLKPKVLKNLCRHILRGLSYLHSRDPPIIHRDLKCDNIFINGNNGVAKIGDLGLATIKNKEHISSVLGTPEFMAPELYDEKYDERVDIYAFGMCVLELVTKEYPYQECTNQAQIYKKVMAGIKPLALSKVQEVDVREFIELCIQHDYRKRPSATELLAHPFLAVEPVLSASGSAATLPGTDVSPSSSPSGLDNAGSNSRSQTVTSPQFGPANSHQHRTRHASARDSPYTSAIAASAYASQANTPSATPGRRRSSCNDDAVMARPPPPAATGTSLGTVTQRSYPPPTTSSPPSPELGSEVPIHHATPSHPSQASLATATSMRSLPGFQLTMNVISFDPASFTLSLRMTFFAGSKRGSNAGQSEKSNMPTSPPPVSEVTKQEIKFPFHLIQDTPEDIVTEMIREGVVCDLTPDERTQVELMMRNVVFGDQVSEMVLAHANHHDAFSGSHNTTATNLAAQRGSTVNPNDLATWMEIMQRERSRLDDDELMYGTGIQLQQLTPGFNEYDMASAPDDYSPHYRSQGGYDNFEDTQLPDHMAADLQDDEDDDEPLTVPVHNRAATVASTIPLFREYSYDSEVSLLDEPPGPLFNASQYPVSPRTPSKSSHPILGHEAMAQRPSTSPHAPPDQYQPSPRLRSLSDPAAPGSRIMSRTASPTPMPAFTTPSPEPPPLTLGSASMAAPPIQQSNTSSAPSLPSANPESSSSPPQPPPNQQQAPNPGSDSASATASTAVPNPPATTPSSEHVPPRESLSRSSSYSRGRDRSRSSEGLGYCLGEGAYVSQYRRSGGSAASLSSVAASQPSTAVPSPDLPPGLPSPSLPNASTGTVTATMTALPMPMTTAPPAPGTQLHRAASLGTAGTPHRASVAAAGPVNAHHPPSKEQQQTLMRTLSELQSLALSGFDQEGRRTIPLHISGAASSVHPQGYSSAPNSARPMVAQPQLPILNSNTGQPQQGIMSIMSQSMRQMPIRPVGAPVPAVAGNLSMPMQSPPQQQQQQQPQPQPQQAPHSSTPGTGVRDLLSDDGEWLTIPPPLSPQAAGTKFARPPSAPQLAHQQQQQQSPPPS